MAPSAAQVLAAVKRSGVKYELCEGWDDPAHQADGIWAPAYVIQHHTANGGAAGNNPSLAWCVRGTYPPVRNCHFLIGRDGTVFVVYAYKAYHAGKGGPGHWGDGPAVQADSMNGRAFGIEVESQGMTAATTATDGFTDAQWASLAALNAALLDLLGAVGEGRIINHKTWAPTRKVDTRFTDASIQARTKTARARLNAKDATAALPVVRLADLSGARALLPSRSAYLVNKALEAEHYLPGLLVRSFWGPRVQAEFRRWRADHGFGLDTKAALVALGARRGFTVA